MHVYSVFLSLSLLSLQKAYSSSAEPCKAKINGLSQLPKATKRFQMLDANLFEVDFELFLRR
jgi:hypothetical protein